MSIDLDARLDDLFSGSLDSFTKNRNALAKELREEDRAQEADEVASLKKPVLSAWVTNQLVRLHRAEVGSLVELQESLESASPEGMRAGIKRRRELISSLTRKAAGILEGTGRSASTTLLQRVSKNLLDTSTPEEREAILAGRLSSDLEGSGLGMWAAPPEEATVEERSPASERDVRKRREAERLEEEARAAENEARELAAQARDAEQHARQTRLDAESAKRKAERARAKADAALERL